MGMIFHFSNEMNLDIDEDFDKDLIEILRKAQEKEIMSGMAYTPVKERVEEFVTSYLTIRSLFQDQGHQITIKKGGVGHDGWFINVRSKTIEISDPKLLVDGVLRLADNFEVCANTDGTLDFCIGFYHMVKGAG